MTPTVTLQPVTVLNWKDCATLSVATDQEEFIPSNLYSIAEAQFYPEAEPFAICNEEHQLVGFALCGRDETTGLWKIFRLMIDRNYQNRGYGGAALTELIHHLQQKPDPSDILISYQTNNVVARELYSRYGFHEEKIDGKRVTARWSITKANQ